MQLISVVILVLVTAGLIFFCGVSAERVTTPGEHGSDRLLIVTTTSVDQTGLMAELEKQFLSMYKLTKVEWMVKSTGAALDEGRNCSVDIVMVPDKEAEDAFIASGYGLNRRYYGSNYYIIIGPEGDPAQIKGKTAAQAFKAIADAGTANGTVLFISRGDNSGTHAKERSIWREAGYNYSAVNNREISPWYMSLGSDIGPVLTEAGRRQAYTIVNAAVFTTADSNLSLVRLVDEGDGDLINIYSVMMVNPELCPDVNDQAAKDWITFMISNSTQSFLREYGKEEYGYAFFIPARGDEERLNVTREETGSMV